MTSDAIASALRRRILSGRNPPDLREPDALIAGANLPSIAMLARDTGVGRKVVERAYDQLRAEGLILSHRGRPSRVADHRPAQVIRYDRYRRSLREHPTGSTTFERQVEDTGWRGRVQHLDATMIACPDMVLFTHLSGHEARLADELDVEVGSPIARRRRLRWAAPLRQPTAAEIRAHEATARRAGREPEALGPVPDLVLERVAEIFSSYIPGWVVDAVEAGAPSGGETILTPGPCGIGGSYSRIERDGGIPIDWIEERILFRAPSGEEAELLKVTGLVMEMVRSVRSGALVVTVDSCVHPVTPQIQFLFGYPHND